MQKLPQHLSQSDMIIQLVDLRKDYNGTEALKGINLYILRNEFITLLGPSGCGKTTTLRLIGGFEYPSAGHVLYEGKPLDNTPPYRRKINTVFQKYALFPHLDVYDNVAFGLKIKKMDKKQIAEKVSAMLDMVNLSGFERRPVDSLSGGQQQRVAIARALVNQPEVLLLDEPLGALDLKLRKGMQDELKKMQQHLGITFIYVTHDQEEALTLSDTIVVMRDGEIQQIGSPIRIYNEPKNAFVARFIGESNILNGVMPEDKAVIIEGESFDCVDEGFSPNEQVDVVVRPEDIYLVEPAHGYLQGVVRQVTFKGVHYEMLVQTAQAMWKIHDTSMRPEGTEVGLIVRPDDIHIMKKEART